MEKNSLDSAGGENSKKEINMVPITEVDPFYNSTFLKLHIDGKLTLSEDRKGPVSAQDKALSSFMHTYRGKNWPTFLQVALHPDIQKEWKPDSFNSIDNEYPRVFTHRQFSGNTPALYTSQENYPGIAVDDLALDGLPDTIENIFAKKIRLTEGDIEHNFFLKEIPKHKILDLREIGLSIKNLGPAITHSPESAEDLMSMLSKSQFDNKAIEEMKKRIQSDAVLRKQIAILIINNNSAIVLDPDYLIDIEAKKKSLKTENIGHAPIPDKVSIANTFFGTNEQPKDVSVYFKELLGLYNLYGTHFTKLQEKELAGDFVKFIENRNGLVYDDVFNVLRNKISLLKGIPEEQLSVKQSDFLKKVEELNEEAEKNYKQWVEEDKKMHEDLKDEYTGDNEAYLHMQAFKEPLNKLIDELKNLA